MANNPLSEIGGTFLGGIAGSAIGGATGGAIGAALGGALGSGQSLNSIVKQALTGDTIKDWDHASRLYVANNYNLAPKSSFLFHVYFDVNSTADKKYGMGDAGKRKELGMLVKSVQLPKYNADMAILNAYNRPHVIQKKMHHSPVQITFHDDSANIVRNFWYDYYNYYYRNADYDRNNTQDLAPYSGVHAEITSARTMRDWGYSVRGSTIDSSSSKVLINKPIPYLNSIRIYSLHNKKFSSYVLVNPIIKDFGHGQHNSSEGAATLEHTMGVEYETVLYGSGSVTSSSVLGFVDLHYDKRPSPLTPAGGGTKSLFGVGGIADTISSISTDLSNNNFAGALFKGAMVGNTLKGANLGTMAAVAAGSLGKDLLGTLGGTGVTNPFGAVSVPSVGGLMTALGGAASGISKGLGIGTMVDSATGITASGKPAGVASLPGSVVTLAKKSKGSFADNLAASQADISPMGGAAPSSGLPSLSSLGLPSASSLGLPSLPTNIGATATAAIGGVRTAAKTAASAINLAPPGNIIEGYDL